jgi:hypothetical protein
MDGCRRCALPSAEHEVLLLRRKSQANSRYAFTCLQKLRSILRERNLQINLMKERKKEPRAKTKCLSSTGALEASSSNPYSWGRPLGSASSRIWSRSSKRESPWGNICHRRHFKSTPDVQPGLVPGLKILLFLPALGEGSPGSWQHYCSSFFCRSWEFKGFLVGTACS